MGRIATGEEKGQPGNRDLRVRVHARHEEGEGSDWVRDGAH